MKLHSNVSSERYTVLQKGVHPGVRILDGFCRSGKTVNTYSNCEAPRKLRIPANFGHPERLDISESVEQTRTTKTRKTQKGNVGNIEDATQLQKEENT